MKYLFALISAITLAVAITVVAPLLAQEGTTKPHSHDEEHENHGHEEEAEKGHNHSHEEPKTEDTHAHKEDKHDHKADTHSHDEEKQPSSGHDEHGHSEGHEHGEDEHSEGGENIGPEKGILEANEEKGFSLSAEAKKNFEITSVALKGQGPWTIPSSARLLAAEEVNIFRVRDGFFKRVDFSARPTSFDQLSVTSPDLKPGDEIVVTGVGFLRIAELAAFGGVAHGHSH